MTTNAIARAGGALLLILSAGTSALRAQDLNADQRQRLFYTVKPAVSWILATAEAQIQLSTDEGVLNLESRTGGYGSGWIIASDGYLVTNGHVVELFHAKNEDRLRMILFFQALQESYFPALAEQTGRAPTQEEQIQIFQQLFPQAQITLKKDLTVFLQNWTSHPAEVKEYSAPTFVLPGKVSIPGQDIETGKDVAILKIEARDLPTVHLGDSEAVQIGDEVYVSGYPAVVFEHDYLSPETALEASFTRGQISSVKLDVKGTSVLQMDAATTWGNSGGPVFSSSGEVIGMATFGSISQMGGASQAIQGFNFAVPANTAREFVRAAGVTNEPGIFDRTWGRALDDFYGGRYQQAIAGFEEVLRLMPDLPDAIKLRREAMLALETAPAPSSWPSFLLPALLALGVLVAVGGVGMRRRGSRSTATAPASGRLVVTEGPLRGNQFPVTSIGIRIGRDAESCQLVLSEATVSREHAVIAPAGTTIHLRNLSGTNPTYVNDRPVQEADLKEGDHIKIGNSIIVYEKV